ncbi:MAG: formylglycine-generating enzyme family protein [Bacteroidota bacterium]
MYLQKTGFRILSTLFFISSSVAVVAQDPGQLQAPTPFQAPKLQRFPEMIKVEGGTFTMGDEEGLGDSSELPLHQVTLKTFRIARTETTVAQWRAFCHATIRKMPDAPAWGWLENHPIVNVSWQDAMDYCKWLSDSSGKKYRLPTEAEWEYAARGGNKSKGFFFSGGQSMYMIGWFNENSSAGTQPVGLKRPNELGIFDMSGNVWEWCADWYGPYTSDAQTNPLGSNEEVFRVLRGGSWNYIAEGGRVANRGFFTSDGKISDYGFRVVLESDEEKTETKEPAKEKPKTKN